MKKSLTVTYKQCCNDIVKLLHKNVLSNYDLIDMKTVEIRGEMEVSGSDGLLMNLPCQRTETEKSSVPLKPVIPQV